MSENVTPIKGDNHFWIVPPTRLKYLKIIVYNQYCNDNLHNWKLLINSHQIKIDGRLLSKEDLQGFEPLEMHGFMMPPTP